MPLQPLTNINNPETKDKTLAVRASAARALMGTWHPYPMRSYIGQSRRVPRKKKPTSQPDNQKNTNQPTRNEGCWRGGDAKWGFADG